MNLSIIIPTRNRPKTLKFALKSVLSIDRNDIEIVVCDNFSSQETSDVVTSFSDKRIRYFRSSERLSMVENFESGIKYATGEYLTILGDDDCILVNMLNQLYPLLSKNRLICWMRHPYFWPDSYKWANLMRIQRQLHFTRLPSKSSLEYLLEFYLNYQFFPSLYNSIVHRDIINNIISYNQKKHGIERFYIDNVLSPDVFSSMLILKFTKSYIFSSVPFSLSGLSKYSNGMGLIFNRSNPDTELFPVEHGVDRLADKYPARLRCVNSDAFSLLSDYILFIEKYMENDADNMSNKTIRSACAHIRSKDATENKQISTLINSCGIDIDSVDALSKNLVWRSNAAVFDLPAGSLSLINCEKYGVYDSYEAGNLYNNIVFNNFKVKDEGVNTFGNIKNRIGRTKQKLSRWFS